MEEGRNSVDRVLPGRNRWCGWEERGRVDVRQVRVIDGSRRVGRRGREDLDRARDTARDVLRYPVGRIGRRRVEVEGRATLRVQEDGVEMSGEVDCVAGSGALQEGDV